MENGTIKAVGETSLIINEYLSDSQISTNNRKFNYKHEKFELKSVRIRNSLSDEKQIFRDQEIILEFEYINNENQGNTYFNIKMKNEMGDYFLVTTSSSANLNLQFGEGHAKMKIPEGFFNEGTYLIELMIINYKESGGYTSFFHDTEFLQVEILQEKREIGEWMGREVGQIRHTFEWTN
jgi:hypothetical protein